MMKQSNEAMNPAQEREKLLIGTARSTANTKNEDPDRTTKTPLRPGRYSSITPFSPAEERACEELLGRHITPLTLVWNAVSVTINESPRRCWLFGRGSKPQNQGKIILKDATGFAEPGSLTAVMGASGSGKSTLLNALTGRLGNDQTVTGQILANGSEVDSSLASITAYVEQDDLFMEWLKVKEHLFFQAALRMDASVSTKERRQRVNEVIQSVGLVDCQDALIGSTMQGGISGGERKRLAFASEILTNPSMLFCDEPTTGLDSFMAHSVVSTLRSLACEGRTVLCTIHQPASAIYALFDRLILVADGSIVFQGTSKEAIEFFESLGYVCPTNYNPADFFIKTLAIQPHDGHECRQRVQKISEAFSKSSYFERVREKYQLQTEHLANDGKDDKSSRSAYKVSWWSQLRACVWRAYLTSKREPLTSKIRIVQTIALGLILGLVFLQEQIDQDGVQNITGALFLLVSNSAFANTFTTVQVIPSEIMLMKREHRNGMYQVDAWFLSKCIIEIPFHMILLPVILVIIPYWMIGLYPAAWNVFMACLVICLATGTAISFAYLLSALSSSVSMALAIAPPIVFGLMLLGGLFINVRDIPCGIAWLSYLSWFRFGFEALLINEWSNIDVIDCPQQNTSVPCVANGQMVLEQFSFDKGNLITDLYSLGILLIVFRVMAVLVLLFRCRRHK